MADKKISQLPAATTPLAGTEVLPIVQNGVTDKVSVANLTAGRAVGVASLTASGSGNIPIKIQATGGIPYVEMFSSGVGTQYIKANVGSSQNIQVEIAGSNRLEIDSSGNTKLNTGNLVIGTSGKGIDFSATAGTGTSELLADYEEGTWTPTVTSGTGSLTSYSSTGAYTKIGRLVTLTAYILITNNGTGASYLLVSGLPFIVGGNGGSGAVQEAGLTGNLTAILLGNGNSTFQMWTYNNGYPGGTNAKFQLTCSYFV